MPDVPIDEQIAGRQRRIDPLHPIRHLAEPDDVGPERSRDAAGGAWRQRPEVLLPARPEPAGEAPGGAELAVHVEQPLRAGALVEIVDVLGDDQQVARPCGIQPRERAVGGVRLHLLQPRPPRVVESVDQGRVAPERLRRRHVLDAVSFPEPVGAAEGGEAALGRDAGAGQDHDVPDVAHRGPAYLVLSSRR